MTAELQAGMKGTLKPVLRMYHHPQDRLRLTIDEERSYLTVKPVWSAPLTRPGRYLSLMDGAGEPLAMITDLEDLDPDSRLAVQTELRQRYLTARVSAVRSARQEFGAIYWSVETDRGTRDFVTQNLQENAQWFSDTHLLLLDVDGNRFEIPDLRQLDRHSQSIIHGIL